MTSLTSANAVRIGDRAFSLSEIFQSLRQRGGFRSLVAETAVELFAVEQSRRAGLSVSVEELQQAANRFRQQNGLQRAEQTGRWLDEQGWSLDVFEDSLERNLLIEKFKDHLVEQQGADYFNSHRADLDRARLRLIVVPDEGLARELQSQVLEQSAEFGRLAREHSLHPSCSRGGQIGWVCRRDLAAESARAIFASAPGDVVCLPIPAGYSLFQVEEIEAAIMDEGTRERCRHDLYRAWVGEQSLKLDGDWFRPSSEAAVS